jgi:hypothetical protein
VARAFGVCWVADYRDPWQPWIDDAQHPTILGLVDGALERHVARRASIVTAVNEPVASDITRRHGVRAFTISNGFDRRALSDASDERAALSPTRFSLVHTGLLAIDAEDPVLSAAPNRSRDVRAFLEALTLLLVQDPELTTRLELVLAGSISDREREALTRGDLGEVVRVLGSLPHTRSLGLQQASDGLLLIPGGARATSAKIFEYLAARKPSATRPLPNCFAKQATIPSPSPVTPPPSRPPYRRISRGGRAKHPTSRDPISISMRTTTKTSDRSSCS